MSYGQNGVKRVKVGNDPRVTGLSDSSAAFVTAHCSPFTLPPDIDYPDIKVPKPGPVRYTESAYMHAMIQVPVNDQGNLLVVSNPNPLGSIPLMWTSATASDHAFYDPTCWANLYAGTQLEKVVLQMKELHDRSSHFRVVGHGLKAWVAAADAVQNKGMIEAGHFVNSDTGDVILPVGPFTTNAGGNADRYPTSGGAMAQFVMNRNYTDLKRTIQSGKTRVNADLAADIGATVRWIAEDDFDWRKSTSHALLAPSTLQAEGYIEGDYYVPQASASVRSAAPLTAEMVALHWTQIDAGQAAVVSQAFSPQRSPVKSVAAIETLFGIAPASLALYVFIGTFAEGKNFAPGTILVGTDAELNTLYNMPIGTATASAYAYYYNGSAYITTTAVTVTRDQLLDITNVVASQPAVIAQAAVPATYDFSGLLLGIGGVPLYASGEHHFVPPALGTDVVPISHTNSQVKFTQAVQTLLPPAGTPLPPMPNPNAVIGSFMEYETGTGANPPTMLRTFYPLGKGRSAFTKNSALWDMEDASANIYPANTMTHLSGPKDWKEDLESCTDFDYFHNIPFIDLTGALPDQAQNKSTVILQVVWQVEYVVPLSGMDYGTHNIVDANWDVLRSITGDEEAFPVVVKGHSFFKNLWSAIKFAGSKIESVLGATSAIASVIPHPYARAIGGAAGIAGAAIGAGRAAFASS